jgi:hypothetical protein
MIVSLAASCIVAAAAGAGGPMLTLQTVAEVGAPAPGFEAEGLLFEGFGNLPVHDPFGDPPPRIDRDGVVTFHAFIGADGIPNTTSPFGERALYRAPANGPEVIVRVGDPAPGTASTFGGFPGVEPFPLGQTPEVQSARVLFHGATPEEPFVNGIWSDRFGPIELVLRDGDVLPGPPPNVVSQFASVFRGETALVNALTVSAVDQKEGLWRDRSGVFETIATDGVPAPGTEPGVTFGEGTDLAFFGSIDAWDANVHGDVVFNGYLKAPEAVCGDNICEIAMGEDCLDCPADCAGQQTGNPADRFCCGGGGGETPVGCEDPRCSTDGLECEDVLLIHPDNDEGIWADGPPELELIMREGEPAPQAGPGHVFGSGANGELGGLATFGHDEIPSRNNDNGALLLGARISSPDFFFKSSIWTTRNGPLELVVTGSSGLPEEPGGPFNEFPGDPAPGLEAFDATFSSFVFGDIANAGTIAFLGFAIFNDNPLSGTAGIWWDAPGKLSLIAAIGLPVPGMPGVVFDNLLYKINTFNDWSHVLFFGEFAGAAGPGNRPLFRANPDGTVEMVLRPGDQVIVNEEELRTVLAFEMGDGQSIDGRRVFEIDFTDGSTGIYTAQIVPAAGHPADLNGDGSVGTADLLLLLAAWGACPRPPQPCPPDFDGDGVVGTADLLVLLAAWG